MRGVHTLLLLVAALLAVTALVVCSGSDESDANTADDIKEMLEKDLKEDGYKSDTGEIKVVEKKVADVGQNIYEVTIKSKNSSFNTINRSDMNNFLSTFRSYVWRINLEGDFTTIGKYTFAGFSALTEFSSPNSTALTLRDMAFKNCTVLESFDARVSNVDSEAFANCTLLGKGRVSITIGNDIGKEAFSGCKNLVSLGLSTWRSSIGESAFAGCSSFIGFYNGGAVSTLSVHYIGDKAFYGCERLREFHLEVRDYTMEIGRDAFKASGLTSLTMTSNTGDERKALVGDGAFADCAYLKNVSIDNVRLALGYNAFYGCTMLTSWESKLQLNSAISQMAFAGCSNLRSVTVNLGAPDPSKTFSVDTNAFQGCDTLTTFTVKGDAGHVITLRDNAFRGCSSLYRIAVPVDSTVAASAFTFNGLPALESIRVVDSDTDALVSFEADGSYAFSGCNTLKSIRLKEGKVYPHMFENSGLVSSPVFVSDSVTIGEKAFANCAALTSFEPAGKKITLGGPFIFMNCTSLVTVDTALVCEAGDISIPDGVFYGCGMLRTVTLDAGTKNVVIDSATFGSCNNLVTLTVTKSHKVTIHSNAFSASGKLKQVSSDEGTYFEVRENAFRGQTGLERITAGSEDAYVYGVDAKSAFAGCTNLRSIALNSLSGPSVVFESMFEGSGVSKINAYGSIGYIHSRGFYGCMGLSSLGTESNPLSVGTLGENAFTGCVNIREVYMDVYHFDGAVYAFSGCVGLSTVHLNGSIHPETITIPHGFLEGCTGLKEFSYDAHNVNCYLTVNSDAFGNCTALKSIRFEETTRIRVFLQEHPFSGCDSLSTIVIGTPGSHPDVTVVSTSVRGLPSFTGFFDIEGNNVPVVTEDGEYAFYGCTSLISVKLSQAVVYSHMFEGSGVTQVSCSRDNVTIGSYAFANCARLTEFKPVFAVDLVGDHVFSGCVNLKTVSMTLTKTGSGVRELSLDTFSGCTKLESVRLNNSGGDTRFVAETFATCSNLASLQVFNTPVVSFGSNVFGAGGALKEVRVDQGAQVVVGVDSFRGQSGLVGIYSGQSGTEYAPVMGNDAQNAFAGCISLKGINLADIKSHSDLTIAQSMFEGAGLQDVTLGEVTRINARAFAGCSKLVHFNSTSYAVLLGDFIFQGCTALETFDATVLLHGSGPAIVIPEGTFSGCAVLKTVSVKAESFDLHLVTGLFAGCPVLESVNITCPKPVTVFPNVFSSAGSLKTFSVSAGTEVVVENSAFRGQAALTGVTVTGTTDNAPVRGHDAEFAFAGCLALESVRITDGVISPHMFEGSGLKFTPATDGITMSISDSAFTGCDKMVSFVTEATVSLSGTYAFRGCTALEALSAKFVKGESDDAFRIPDGTFEGCAALKTVVIETTHELPVRLDTGVFGTCSHLESVSVLEAYTVMVSPNVFAASGTLSGFYVDPNCIVIVEENAFRNQTALTGVRVADTLADASIVGSDARFAFAGCIALSSVDLRPLPTGEIVVWESMFEGSGLEKLVFTSAARIDARAFAGCSKLVQFKGYSPVVFGGDFAFQGCTALETFASSVTVATPGSVLEIPEGTFAGCAVLKTVTVDVESADARLVTGLFSGCPVLESVTVTGSRSVTVCSNVFSSTASLKAFAVDSGAEVVVESGAFRGQTLLTGITVSGSSQDAPVRGHDAEFAFAGCLALGSLYVPNGVFVAHMFEGSGLRSAPVTDGTTMEVSDSTFAGCDKMVSFVTDASVTISGTYAFRGCTALEVFSALLAKGASEESCIIPDGTFEGCSALKTVVMETALESVRLDTGVFGTCTQLETVSVLNSDTVTVRPNVFAATGALKGFYVDSSSVVIVEENAFRNQSTLSGVFLADTTENAPVIGDDARFAFAGCLALSSLLLQFEDSKVIWESMFEGSGLEQVVISDGVRIDARAFAGCSKLIQFRCTAPVTFGGDFTLQGCSSLETFDAAVAVATPGSVLEIPEGTFAGCAVLKNVSVDAGATDVRLVTGLFSGCPVLDSVTFTGSGSVAVGSNVFSTTGSLKTFSVGAGAVVENSAFRGQASLTGITVSGSTQDAPVRGHDAEFAFASCLALGSVRIADGVFAAHMFEGSGLKSAPVIDGTTMNISDSAFAGCDKMISFVTDASVTLSGTYAFRGCTALEAFSVLLVKDASEEVCQVPDGTFEGCAALKSVVIETTLESVCLNTGAFGTCSQLETVSVLNSATVTVRPNVFTSSGALKGFFVDSSSVVIVEENAFRNQSSLKGVFLADTTEDAPVIGTDARFAFAGCLALSSLLLQFEDPSDTNVIWESMFEGSGIRSVGIYGDVILEDRAFANCAQLVEVNGVPHVKTMDGGVFTGCVRLETVEMEVDDLSEAIEAFSGCVRLRSVVLHSATSDAVAIPYGFFNGCGRLQSLTLDGEFHLSRNALNGCDILSTIQVASVLRIDSEAFRSVSNLENVFVKGTSAPAQVIVVGSTDYAFYGCTKLRNLNLSVVGTSGTIGEYMFYNCLELARVTFDKNVVWSGFGDYAFSGCAFLRGISLSDGSPVVFGDDVHVSMSTFSGCNSLEEIAIESKGTTVVFGNSSVVGNNALGRIIVNGASSVVFEDHALGSSPSLTDIIVSGAAGSSVSLGEASLSGASGLKTLDVGEASLSIGTRAMENLTHLTEVRTGGITSVGDYGLYGCSLLANAALDPSITVIGAHAFDGCSELQLPVLGTGLKTLGDYAFSGCVKIPYLDLSHTVLESVGEGAFLSCNKMTSVALPSTVKSIGAKAFQNCGMLNSVNFANLTSLETIGDDAFASTALVSLEFTSSLKSIGKESFAECQKLSTLVFGRYLESIGESAFRGCSALSSLVIPSSVTHIGESAFRGCSALQGVDVRDAVCLTVFPAMLFSDCVKLEYLLLPNGVKEIGDRAFSGCTYLSILDFGDSNGVEVIGEGAFAGCGRLVSMEFPSVRQIGQQAFNGCASLTTLVLPASLDPGAVFGNYMFAGCSSLLSIAVPANVESIGDYAFSECYSLGELLIPATVSGIGAGAFESCVSLEVIDGSGCGIFTLGAGAFDGCIALECINVVFRCALPEKAFEGCVALEALDLSGCSGSIPQSLALGCASLSSVILPDSCGVIGDHAFDGCTSLSLSFINPASGELEIGSYAFNGCSSMSTFPECTIRSVGAYAFNDCANFDARAVTWNVTEVPEYAFAGCSHLTNIPEGATVYGSHSFEGVASGSPAQEVALKNAVTIGDYAFCGVSTVTFALGYKVATIGEHAFEGAGFDGLLSSNNLHLIGARAFSGSTVENLIVTSENPEGVAFKDFSFAECPELRTVKVHVSNLLELSPSTFDDCPKLESIDVDGSFTEYNGAVYSPDMKVLFKVVKHIGGEYELHPDTTSIGAYAFKDCVDVTSLKNTGKLVSVGEHAFEGCASLARVDLANVKDVGDYAFAGSGVTTVDIGLSSSVPEGVFKGCTKLTSVGIANGAEIIGAHAFEGCASLNGLEISKVRILGEGCFSGCTGLNGALAIPSTVISMGAGAFSGCTGVTEVRVGAPVAVPEDCFNGCTSLRTVRMASGTPEIGSGAFSGCTALSDILIPEAVTSVGDRAFAGCTSLEYLVLPERMTVIGNGLFTGCTSLEFIDLPLYAVSVGDEAFSGCSSLVHVEFHNKVRSIGECAFKGCTSLGDVEVPSSTRSIGIGAFSGCTSMIMFYIPELVSSIEDEVFAGCTSLSGIILHRNVTHIGDRAFSGCTSLIGLTEAGGLRQIGSLAFEDCRSLQSFAIERSTEVISFNAFSGCTSLASVEVDPENRVFTSDGTRVFENKDGEPWILLKVLPGDDVKEVTVPATVTIVSPMALYGLPALSKVVFLGDVELIGERNFELCPVLDAIEISSEHYRNVGPALMSEDGRRILAVTGTGRLEIPATVEEIDTGAFLGMGRCSEVVVDQGNQKFRIDGGALLSKDGTTLYRVLGSVSEYTVPSGVRTVWTYAFGECGVKSISVTGSVVFMTSSIFHCKSLSVLHIGSKDVVFQDDAVSAGARGASVTVHVDAPEGYRIPADAIGDYTSVDYGHVDPSKKDDGIGLLLPSVAVIAIAAAVGAGVFIIRRR